MCEGRGNGLLYDGRYVEGCLRPRSLRVASTAAVCVYIGEGRSARQELARAKGRLDKGRRQKFQLRVDSRRERTFHRDPQGWRSARFWEVVLCVLPWETLPFPVRGCIGGINKNGIGICMAALGWCIRERTGVWLGKCIIY
ncbi:unnamed protein product [Ectocarpus fasciculatus]